MDLPFTIALQLMTPVLIRIIHDALAPFLYTNSPPSAIDFWSLIKNAECIELQSVICMIMANRPILLNGLITLCNKRRAAGWMLKKVSSRTISVLELCFSAKWKAQLCCFVVCRRKGRNPELFGMKGDAKVGIMFWLEKIYIHG